MSWRHDGRTSGSGEAAVIPRFRDERFDIELGPDEPLAAPAPGPAGGLFDGYMSDDGIDHFAVPDLRGFQEFYSEPELLALPVAGRWIKLALPRIAPSLRKRRHLDRLRSEFAVTDRLRPSPTHLAFIVIDLGRDHHFVCLTGFTHVIDPDNQWRIRFGSCYVC